MLDSCSTTDGGVRATHGAVAEMNSRSFMDEFMRFLKTHPNGKRTGAT